MPRKKTRPDPLWKADHPYYASQGCYFVSHVVGHANALGNSVSYDGNTCHTDFASWQDFKTNKVVPYPEQDLITRKLYGINDEELAKARELWKQQTKSGGLYDADQDYNLLYRWDWKSDTLNLYYIQQRKALPVSASIKVKKSDEPEIREWLGNHWLHMMRVWAPVSGWPINDPADKHQAIEHASCALAEVAKTYLPQADED